MVSSYSEIVIVEKRIELLTKEHIVNIEYMLSIFIIVFKLNSTRFLHLTISYIGIKNMFDLMIQY